MILLDVEDETIWKFDEIHEEGIRLAAALASRLLQQGIPVGIRTNGRDLKNDECFSLNGGTGPQQVRSLYEGLTRLDLTKKAEHMEVILDRLREEKENGNRTYVMISKNQRESCYEGFDSLLQDGGTGAWIATLYDDMEWKLPENWKVTTIRWEVAK